MKSVEWHTVVSEELPVRKLSGTFVQEHPLKNVITVTERIPRRILGSQPSTGRTTPVSTSSNIMDNLTVALKKLDPLTEFALEEIDPLTKMASEMDAAGSGLPKDTKDDKTVEKPFGKMDSWESRKAFILSKYTTSEKLSMITSFLSEGEKVVVKAQSTAIDKVQHRLEQLDYFEEGSQRKLDLSQVEYTRKIELLNKELVSAWNTEQRVKALKIAIQCAKMLADTDVLPFYPSKFVLITDILDVFGKLVYERLRVKAEYYKPGSKTPTSLPEDFTPDMVPDSAKETCLNWFYKIASIRELIPRLYVEMALIKSYNFISSNECTEALSRLTEMLNGIGNPLVAVYARCYLCRVGVNVLNKNPDRIFFTTNFIAFLDSYTHLFSRSVKAELHKQKMLLSTYMVLYTPALDYILSAVACDASENILNNLLDRCKRYSNSSLILNTIMSAFKPAYISDRCLQFLDMINQCTDDGIPLYLLLRTLGLCVCVYPPPMDQRKKILNLVWKNISVLSNPGEYIVCVEAWIPYVAQCFSCREVNSVLGDIIDHMIPNRYYENYYTELKEIVKQIVSQISDYETLLAMDSFLPLIDLFQQESVKVEVCKHILTSLSNDNKTSDPVISNSLMFLCSVLHDSVNALTPEDEQKQIGEILCNIVRKVDFGRDFEQQLNFYVEARGAFSNLDPVLAQLVQCVNTLAVNTRQIVKGLHTKKTGNFVRACAAYCFITIPSILSAKVRLELYLLSGQVALFNQCLGQADACFNAALQVIPELDDSSCKNEAFLISFVQKFLSVLLVVPDNPERGVLHLPRMLLNVLREYNWNKQNCSLATVYISAIDYLCATTRDIYPYHVDKVESNDTLYGSDPKFIKEVNSMISIVIGEILVLLKELGSCRRQSQIAVELFYRFVTKGDLSLKLTSTMALNLWELSLENGYGDVKYMMRLRQALQSLSVYWNNDLFIKIVDQLALPAF